MPCQRSLSSVSLMVSLMLLLASVRLSEEDAALLVFSAFLTGLPFLPGFSFSVFFLPFLSFWSFLMTFLSFLPLWSFLSFLPFFFFSSSSFS